MAVMENLCLQKPDRKQHPLAFGLHDMHGYESETILADIWAECNGGFLMSVLIIIIKHSTPKKEIFLVAKRKTCLDRPAIKR